MDKCPYCGSAKGVYKTYTGMQYYDFDGNAAGYHADDPENQKKFARCIHCDRKISLSRIRKEAAEKSEYFCTYGERRTDG